MTSEHSEQATGRGGPRRNERRQPAFGMQRVSGCETCVLERAVTEAIGVLRRRPVLQRISMATAAELVARGTPLAVHTAAATPPPAASERDTDATAEGR